MDVKKEPCDRGSYLPVSTPFRASCKLCTAGTWSTGIDASECSFCPDGYWSGAGKHTCEQCPAGKFSKADGICKACSSEAANPDGLFLFQDKPGQSACKTCPSKDFFSYNALTNEKGIGTTCAQSCSQTMLGFSLLGAALATDSQLARTSASGSEAAGQQIL